MDIVAVISHIKAESSTVTVHALADKFGYSEAYFSRAFKQEVGISPSEYIQAVKREQAIEEIITNDRSILSSQLKAGYLSEGSFSNLIKKAMSISPKQLSKNKLEILKDYNDSEKDYLEEAGDVGYDLHVNITCSEKFDGIVFVGLFKKPLPDRPPVIGIPILNYPKNNCVDFSNVPPGSYYVMACVIHKTLDPTKVFVMKDNLRGKIDTPFEFPGKYNCELLLRPPHISDPPITVNLPKLFIETVKSKVKEFRSD